MKSTFNLLLFLWSRLFGSWFFRCFLSHRFFGRLFGSFCLFSLLGCGFLRWFFGRLFGSFCLFSLLGCGFLRWFLGTFLRCCLLRRFGLVGCFRFAFHFVEFKAS